MSVQAEPAHMADEVEERLLRHDISPTRQRRQIARILFARPQHLSADQVLEQVNREEYIASKATVYNTLGLFAAKGLVREVIVDPTKVFYDSNTEPHHHFYHVDTGRLQDVDSSFLALANLPDLPEGTELEGVDIIVKVRAKA